MQMSKDGALLDVAADVERLALAYRELSPAAAANETNATASPRDGGIFDFLSGERFMHERFFEELVCYKSDLGLEQAGAAAAELGNSSEPGNSSDGNVTDNGTAFASGAAFLSALGEVLGAPIDLYESAKHHAGARKVAGVSCTQWAGSRKVRRSLADLTSALQLAASAAARLVGVGAPPWAAMLEAVENASEAGIAIGDAEFAEAALFCVSTSGDLLAADARRKISVEVAKDANTTPSLVTIWHDNSHMLATALATGPPSAALFNGTRGVAGGSCIDLSEGSTGAQELRAHLNGEERLARINREAAGLWEAAPCKLWQGVTVAEVVPTLGTEIRPLRLPQRRDALRAMGPLSLSLLRAAAAPGGEPAELPRVFDPRKQWPQCESIATIRNQGMCGSCWAFAAAAVLSDRFCIASAQLAASCQGPKARGTSKGNATVGFLQEHAMQSLSLAPMHMVDCDAKNGGCQGGRLDDAWWFLRDHGVPSEACAPYRLCPVPTEPRCAYTGASLFAKDPSSPPQCAETCSTGERMQVYRAAAAYAVGLPADVPAMQRELMLHGPVEVGFFVFSDFHSYHRGVYFRTPGAYGPLGGHAVRLLGWGTDSVRSGQDVDYWLAANSWSPLWGMGGFFRIRRGTNECGIETTPAAGLPQLDAHSPSPQGGAADV